VVAYIKHFLHMVRKSTISSSQLAIKIKNNMLLLSWRRENEREEEWALMHKLAL
jgi:hypothetical protein